MKSSKLLALLKELWELTQLPIAPSTMCLQLWDQHMTKTQQSWISGCGLIFLASNMVRKRFRFVCYTSKVIVLSKRPSTMLALQTEANVTGCSNTKRVQVCVCVVLVLWWILVWTSWLHWVKRQLKGLTVLCVNKCIHMTTECIHLKCENDSHK